METVLIPITKYLYTFHLLLATPRTKWWPDLSLSFSPSAQTQTAKRTAQTEAAKHTNEQLLKIMCKIKLYS
jgi:hypothetical protein